MGSYLSSANQDQDEPSTSAEYELVLYWHLVFRALCRGNEQRAGLPPELVLLIFRMAPIVLRQHSLDARATNPIVVRARNADIAYKDWFASGALSATTIRRLASVALFTASHDQGWADRIDSGSWTWFEICIASPAANNQFVVAKRADNTELRWVTHHNQVATSSAQRLRGGFDEGHELWRYLREGHVILVRACAQFMGWQNFALEGMLRFWIFFEPVLV